MHGCLMLFTKELPSKNDIENLMGKYNDSAVYGEDGETVKGGMPQFTWDYYEIGGRYNGSIKLKFEHEDPYYRWDYYEREPRNGRLFWAYIISQFEENKPRFFHEESCFGNMGAVDGAIYVDGARISDILNYDDLNCYTFMTEDGEAYARSWYDGNRIADNNDFEEKLKAAKQAAKENDQFVTIIDYHD